MQAFAKLLRTTTQIDDRVKSRTSAKPASRLRILGVAEAEAEPLGAFSPTKEANEECHAPSFYHARLGDRISSPRFQGLDLSPGAEEKKSPSYAGPVVDGSWTRVANRHLDRGIHFLTLGRVNAAIAHLDLAQNVGSTEADRLLKSLALKRFTEVHGPSGNIKRFPVKIRLGSN